MELFQVGFELACARFHRTITISDVHEMLDCTAELSHEACCLPLQKKNSRANINFFFDGGGSLGPSPLPWQA